MSGATDHGGMAFAQAVVRSLSTADASSETAVIDRLESVLREEAIALRSHEFLRLPAFTERKAHCLLELRRLASAKGGSVPTSLTRRLSKLKRELESNKRLLAVHLRAAGEIAEILSRALHGADGDGTYTPQSVRREIR